MRYVYDEVVKSTARSAMLQKLRSRHPIDIPAEGFGRSTGLLVTIGGLGVLAVIVPLVLAILEGALTAPLAIALGVGVVILTLLILGAFGAKPGYARLGSRSR